MVATLSDLFRYQLKASKTELVQLNEECSFIKDYLSLEQARFGDRLKVDFRISTGAGSCLVPPMLIQPLVENAVKHGISPIIKGGSVHIIAQLDEQHKNLSISVIDTGVGFSNNTLTKGEGVGLSNIRRRLDLQFGESLVIEKHHPKGTKVAFTIPAIKEAKSTHPIQTASEMKVL
ncbi:MAG: ATP-binding protein, partial [Bacteroidota bacterium]